MEKGNPILTNLSKPAQRALTNAGITSLKQFTQFSEQEISSLHGIGPNAMATIKQALLENGLSFANK